MASPSAVPEPLNDDDLELSAAARESFGFADDQFMELSTSGASIYSLPNLISEQSSTSSGRLAPSSGGSSNSSFKRALLGAPGRATQDESSLRCSGMSLASLGSLSRSVGRLSASSGCEETFADPNAWRDAGSGARSSPERGAGVQELSGPIAELRRQQSFSRRWSSGTFARSEPAPPPLPVGVDAAPVQPYSSDEQAGTLHHNTTHAPDNFVSTSGGPGSLSGTQVPATRDPAWGGVLQETIVIAARDGGDPIGRGDGSGGGDADGVPSGKSPETKPRTKGSLPVRALLRSIGLGGARQQDGGGATQHRTGNAASGEVEGLSVTSWSPDSSSREGARSNASSVNAGGGNSPMMHGGGQAFRTRSAPTSAHASEAGPTSDTEVASKSEGIRGRLAQAFRRKGGKSSQKRGQGRDEEAMSDTPAGADGGQFEVIRPDPRLGEAPQPGVYPEWYRSRSAPVGPTDSELKMDAFPDLLARAFPGTPLGTSNRSFDANQAFSPSAYEPEESNSSLPMPPRLGTNAAREGLGASFDPNLSVKSLFDTSYSADPAQRDLEATSSWSGQEPPHPHPTEAQAQQSQQQQGQAGTMSSMGPGIGDDSLRDTSASQSPSHPTVDTGTGTTRDIRTGESVSMVAGSGLVARDSLVRTTAVLLDQDQLANDLSDLSVSAGSHRRGDDNPQAADNSPGMDVSSDAPATHDTPTLKASGLPSSVGMPWLPDGPTLGQDEGDRHQPGSWLHGADGIDPTAGNRIHPLANARAASHDPKAMNNGMWRLTSRGTASAAGHDAGLGSDPSWALEAEASLPSRGDGGDPGGLLAAEIEPLADLGPIPTTNPLSGSVGRAQSADLDMLRRKAAAAGSHVEGSRAYKGKGHPAHLRGRSGPRHVSLELGKASSPDISASRGATDFSRGMPSERTDPLLSSSSTSTVPLGSNGPSVTSTDSPGGNMLWAAGSPVGAAYKKGSNQAAVPSPAAAGSSATVSIRPAIGASRDNPVGAPVPSSSRQTPSPWWTTRDSLPRRDKSSNRSGSGADSTMIRPSSLPRAKISSASEASDSSSRLSMSLPKGSREEAKHDVSWSALHAMIPTPGMGSKKGVPSGGDSSGAGLSSGESETGRVGASGTSERADILGDSASAAVGGIGGSDHGDEVLDSSTGSGGLRILGPLGMLDIFGKHKKQCLDGADLGGNEPQLPSQDAFDYLREQLAMPAVEPALPKPQPSTSTSTSGKTSTVSDTSKANRQAVAARRPRNRGRFMKSQQKWVTQVELKQEKIKNAAAASAGGGEGAGVATVAYATAPGAAGSEMVGSEDRGAGPRRAEGSVANTAVTAAGSAGSAGR